MLTKTNCCVQPSGRRSLSYSQFCAKTTRSARKSARTADVASFLAASAAMTASKSLWKTSSMNVSTETSHRSVNQFNLVSALFGIPRKCPKDPLAESFWDVKQCDNDKNCDFPRICCPNGRKRYCMNSYTEPEELPVGRQIAYPVESLSQYFQCTPPPPAAFDKYPKPCNSSLTCFPNICCLEGGQKHCRPPKRNILAALTTFSQRFNVGWIRDFTDNLVIRR